MYIYGYDLVRRAINTADNYNNWKYGCKEIAFCDMEEGFRLANMNSIHERNHKTFFYKLKAADYKFDIDYLINLLEDYLYSRDSTSYKSTQSDKIYGIQCYEVYFQYLDNLDSDESIDLKSFVFMSDYKEIMEKRLIYLIEHGYLKNKAVEMLDGIKKNKQLCEINMKLAMKYNMTSADEILKKIRINIAKMYQDEQVFIQTLLEEIKDNWGRSFDV